MPAILRFISSYRGTVVNSADYHVFPDAAICAECPGYVPARYTTDFTVVEYQGAAPELVQDPITGMIWSRAVLEQRDREETACLVQRGNADMQLFAAETLRRVVPLAR